MSPGAVFGQSRNYTVTWEFETVWLEGSSVPEGLVIGYFYGATADGAIDPDERWCVMVGCGVIVYRLGPPWEPFHFEGWPFQKREVALGTVHVREPSQQWWEYGSHASDYLWLESVEHVDGERFEAVVIEPEKGPSIGPTRYAILAEAHTVRPANWLPDIV